MAIVLFLAAVLSLLRASLGPAFAGLLIGFAACITLKTVLFIPTLLFLVIWNFPDWRLGRNAAIELLLCCLLTWTISLSIHSALLPSVAAEPVGAKLHTLSQGFLHFGIGQYAKQDLGLFIYENAFVFGLLLIGIYCCVRQRGERSVRGLSCFLPMLGVMLFYRNSFSYFYPFIFAPAILIAAKPFEMFVAVNQHYRRAGILVALIFVVGPAGQHVVRLFHINNGAQRALLAEVHRRYSQSTRYIDRCGMVPSFEKVGPFMSTYVMSEYRRAAVPHFEELLARWNPQFILDCGDFFVKDDERYRLLPADKGVLERNFVLSPGCIHPRSSVSETMLESP